VDDHPIRAFFDRGLSVTVNTDDPAVSQTNINNEFRTLSENFDFTTEECRQLLLNAVDAAFVEKSRKQTFRRILKVDEKGERES
jgi:adenosine deaminase